MSLDLKLAVFYFAVVVLIIVVSAGRMAIRKIVDDPLLRNEHAFYVRTTGEQPKCATCPMNKRCPYYGNGRCKFSILPSAKI